MPRAIILVMDSFGIGAAGDAAKYGDQAANTFKNIAIACAENKIKRGPIHLPNLQRLGLYAAARHSSASEIPGEDIKIIPQAAYGYAQELSIGKDTPSGHWEMAGLPVTFEWGIFPDTFPCFPKKLTDALIKQAQLPGLLGNRYASGTQIIEELGIEHITSKKPIVYTSTDSTLQIAAHEQHFGLERLYDVCKIARTLVDEYKVGRVIARPFIGEVPGQFKRTARRHDYATPPHAPTLLNYLADAGKDVIAIGKISDIFAHSGVTQSITADGNMALFDATLKACAQAPDGSLIFSNFVDFDSSFGHRRDILGYANALEEFDARLPELEKILQADDLVVITADHGCDPTMPGYSHTREYIPVLILGHKIKSGFVGRRSSFADIGQTIAKHLGIKSLEHGTTIL